MVILILMNYLTNNYKGFNNLGNTCYLNSGLQLIINNKDLCLKILGLPNNNYDENTAQILIKLKEFIINYYNINNTGTLDPTFIKQLVANKNNEFVGFKQNDSFEFIIYFLDFIFDVLKVNKLYELTTNIKIKCKLVSCLNISEHDEKNNYLILDVLNDYKHLDDCYRNYKQREKLMNNNSYYCEKCKAKGASSQQLIGSFPKCMIFHLPLDSNVNYSSILVLNKRKYALSSVICYDGAHWWTYGRDMPPGSAWFILNDGHIMNHGPKQFPLSNTTRMLIYYCMNE